MRGSGLTGWLSVEQCLGARGELKWKLSYQVILHGEDFQSSSPLVKFGNPQGKATTWHVLVLKSNTSVFSWAGGWVEILVR